MSNKITKMKTLLIISGIILLAFNGYAQKTNELQAIKRPADYEYLSAPDSLGVRTPLKQPSQKKNSSRSSVHLPYPIIFIHGLCSNASTWYPLANFMDTLYGFDFGGRFDFCLNFDSDNSVANKNFWPAPGADLALYTDVNNPAIIGVGEYYFLNFDVGSNGSVSPSTSDPSNVLSNQSSIAKQGLALKWAIYFVLQKTGSDKVILMGHSMGGLASREYLQNQNLWQPDGKHHVAKLVTTGTPHGGSNASLSELLDAWAGIDDQSDAVRDLRTSYYYSGSPGVYLFGGNESDAVMNDMLFDDFYNVDANCNSTLGENVTGLNQKNLSASLDYANIIGLCNCTFAAPGDGVVSDISADMNNFYPGVTTNLFYYYASAITQIHTDLPNKIYEDMQGLDEPNDYYLAYHVGFDTTYTAFTTMQPIGGYLNDYDDFKFSVPVNGNVSVNINNIFLSNLKVRIVDLAGNIVGTMFNSSGASSINFMQMLNAGDYFLEIYGIPNTGSYLYPYNFVLTRTNIPTSVELTEKNKDIQIYPNPNIGIFNITFKTAVAQTEVEIYNALGEKIYAASNFKQQTSCEINISNYPKGIYFVKIYGGEKIYTEKIVIQ